MKTIVVGSINLDLVARVPKLPAPGETLTGSTFEMLAGGKGANQALAARRAGADVTMVGAVGTDANGDVALSNLRTAGVDLSNIAAVRETPTGVAMILVDDRSGENEIVVIPGANAHAGEPLRGVEFEHARVLLLQMEVPTAVNKRALALAKSADLTTVLNVAPFSNAALDLAQVADVTIANETEFDALAKLMDLEGSTRHERAMAFAVRTGKTIVVTLGPDGAFAATMEGLVEASAPAITAVDTVGAGDTFCGYFAIQLASKSSLQTALEVACTAAALACKSMGAQAAIPNRDDVERFGG
ncbi:MAG: ribokinase [Pseudomonadota bacterium]